jgi:hypothetical protein
VPCDDPLGSENLRAMFEGSNFKSSGFSNFVSTGAPSRFREGKQMLNFEGHY